MLIDMDPEDGAANGNATFAPVNTSAVLGSTQDCAQITENDTLDADEDVTADTLTIDVTATNIPAANAITGYSYDVRYSEASLTVQSQTFNVAATNILARTAGSNLFNVSDAAPDTDANDKWSASALDIGAAAAESGSGVLDRLTISSDAGAAMGLYNLSLANAVHLDVSGAYFPDNMNWDSDGDTVLDGVQNVGRIALGQGCPMPPVDIEIVALSLTSMSGPTVPSGTDFTIRVAGTATSNGPNTADIQIDLDLAVPADCTRLPNGAQSESFPAVPALASRTSTKDWTVNCSQPSSHQFDATGSVTVTGLATDTNLANNGPINTSGTVTVTGQADIGVSGLTVSAPPTAPVSAPFNVTVSGTLHNAGPVTPVTVDATLDLAVPVGCTRLPNASQSDTGVSLALSTSVPISKMWTVTCSAVGVQNFDGSATVAVNQLHVTDPNAANDTALASGSTNVQGPADLKVTGVTVTAPPTSDSGVPFGVTVTATLHNNGPSTPVDGDATLDLQLPADCSKAPNGSQSNTVISLPLSQAVQTSSNWTVTCTDPSFHVLTGTTSVTPSSPQISDPTPGNNSGQGQATTGIVSTSDPKVTGVTVTAPSDAATGAPFTVTVTATVHNNGPISPLGVDVTSDLMLPAGCSSVPALPQTTSVSLVFSTPVQVQESWTVTCVTQGLKTFTGTSNVAVTQLHIADSNANNNTASGQASTNTSLGAADVKVTSVAVTSPANAPIDTNFGVTVNTIVHNNGPFFPVNTDITLTLNLPPDCFTPVTTLTFYGASLGPSVAAMLPEITFFVTCIDHSFHDFTATATIVVNDPLAGDPNPGNNTLVSSPSTTAVLRTSDLKVNSATVGAPATAITNTPFNVTVDASLHDNGPDPAPANVTVTLTLPPDCSAPGNPRTVPVSLPVSTATSLPTQTFSVTCTTRSDHTFSATVDIAGPVHVIDPNGGNNSATSGNVTVGVFDQSDLKVTGVTVTSPPQAVVGTPFNVSATTVIHNNGPYGPANSDLTVTLALPPDCSTLDPNPRVVPGLLIPVSVPTPVNASWSVTCTSQSLHGFSATSTVAVNQFHVEDPLPGNNSGSSATATTAVFAQSDLKVIGVTVSSPAQGIVGTPFSVGASATVHNNGPFGPANATVSIGLSLPPDCTTADPNPQVAANVSLPVSVPVTLNAAWTVTCTAQSFHDFSAGSSVTVDQLHVEDPDGVNNSATSTTSTTAVFAQADLKVTSVVVAGPAQGIVGTPFNVTATTTVHNNGPFGPANASVSVALTLPLDCTTLDPNPQVTPNVSLPVSAPTPLNAVWSVTCSTESFHTFSASSSVTLDQFHVEDPDGANNAAGSPNTTVPVFAQADGKIVSSTILNPPVIVPANTSQNITVRKVLHNNGPFGPATFNLSKSITAPAGCTVTPPTLSSHALSVSTPVTVDEVWVVTCVAGTYTFNFVNTLAVTGLHINDPNSANNSATTSLTLAFESDADGIPNDVEVACGSNPNNTSSIPERIDGVYAGTDNDLDTLIDEALPPGAAGFDCDRDGYTGTSEAHVFTPSTQGDQDPCGTSNVPLTAPPSPIGWPADTAAAGGFSANKVNISDLAVYVGVPRYLNTNVGAHPGDIRLDVVPGPGGPLSTDINIVDLANILNQAPPMLGNVRAFNGPSCPFPP